MARIGQKWLVVIDGQQDKLYDIINGPSLAFSPDSRRVAYLARDGEHWVAIIDGQESKPYDDARGLLFSPDSFHAAYVANIDGNAVLMVDGKKAGSYDDLGSDLTGDWKILYSSDGRPRRLWRPDQRPVVRPHRRQAAETLRRCRRSRLLPGRPAGGLCRKDRR